MESFAWIPASLSEKLRPSISLDSRGSNLFDARIFPLQCGNFRPDPVGGPAPVIVFGIVF